MIRFHMWRSAVALSLFCTLTVCMAASPNPEVKIADAPLCSSPASVGSGMAGSMHGPGSSNVVVSIDNESGSDMQVYRAGFSATTWNGSLEKFVLGAGKTDLGSAGEPIWDASAVLTGTGGKQGVPPRPLPGERRIYLGRRNADKSFSMAEFRWENLNSAQRAVLNHLPQTMKEDGLGEKRVAYLRGDRSLELDKPAGLFRQRESLLGDIVNSNPVYVGVPSRDVRGDGYQTFYETNKHRVKAVYVGANDGMLHGFNADDGSELFAYIPNSLLRDLPALTHPAYQHRPFVDGGISVSEAIVAGQWKTLLVSGMGGGAQGVFALDVTRPDSFGAGAGAIFEFTDEDDPDMGNVSAAPLVAKFRTTKQGVPAVYKHFVVVASGMNNYRNDGKGLFNSDGAGALFLLSLDKPAGEPWKLGRNYYKFRTPSKDPSLQNGLAMPALVAGDSGEVRFAYAGDLQGSLWRFNFTGELPWKAALGSGEPLFVARDERGTRQPISVQPRVVFAPGGGYVVLFGTGKFIESADSVSTGFARQSFYGIYDTTEDKYKISDRTEFAVRNVSPAGEEQFNFSGTGFEYGVVGNGKRGWYFDFFDAERTGERAVAAPVVLNGTLYINTLLPTGVPCVSVSTRTYVLNPLTGLSSSGGRTGVLSPINLPGPPVPIEASTLVSERNPVGRRLVRKTYFILDTSAGTKNNGIVPRSGNANWQTDHQAGRLSWREIVNWQELRRGSGGK